MIDSPKQRLSKLLAKAGVASRRAAEELIFAGKVTVNGEVCKVPQTQVSEKDTITVSGQAIGSAEKKLYFVLNKPTGYLCSTKGSPSSKLVLQLFSDIKERLFTVGRLDKDTEGLLIVTNDGHFAQKVIHPSNEIHKEYLVKTDHELTDEHLKAIGHGTLVEGVFVKPIRVQKIRRGTLKIVIGEGKKREVRQMLASAGLEVKSLCRIRIGQLQLGNLAPGERKEMSERDKELIFE